MARNGVVKMVAVVMGSLLTLMGCSGSKNAARVGETAQDDLALDHYIQGSVLDEKGEYAKAILEFQDAIRYKKDPAIYHSIAKDYSLLGKHDLAVEMGEEAVRLAPTNRVYREMLAEIYVNALNLDGAVNQYREIIRNDSSYEEAWMNLAHLLQVRQPEAALKVYDAYLQRFGPNAEAYSQMYQIYTALQNPAKAAEAVKGMLQLDPENFELRQTLGAIYLQEDSVDAALRLYDDLVQIRPDNLEVRAAIAHAYLVKQDYADAMKQFDAVMKKDSVSIEDQLRFGRVFVAFIQKDSAVAPYAMRLFQQIQEGNPSDWRPYWFLGAIDNIVRNDSEALTNFGQVRKLASWNPDGWVGVASVYYDWNRFDEAIEVLTEAKTYVPNEGRVYFLLGIAYQRKHQDVESASALEKAIQIDGKNVDALGALGLVYDEMKRHEDSDSAYERALRIDPKNHLVLNNYGYSLAERGIQLERALAMSRDAVAQQPQNQSYLDTYGWIYFRLGNYEEAKRWIQKAVDLGSPSPVINEHLGDVYFKLSDKDKAMEYWQKALKLDATNQLLKEKLQRGSL